MRRTSRIVLIALFVLVTPATATIDSMQLGTVSGDLDHWQRIDLRFAGLRQRNPAQIKVAIRTKGPRLQGLIRIPGALASNFDTGNGMTVVDLINAGDDNRGYAEIVALEILLTQTMPGQFYEVFAVEDWKQAK